MNARNLSPQAMFLKMAAANQPQYHFTGSTPADVTAWQAAAKPEVLATLGAMPKRVPTEPELIVEWTHDGLRKQRWLINIHEHLSGYVLVNYPADQQPGGDPRPAIQCWHGHGRAGKEAVMGNAASADQIAETERHNYDYGHQMAKAGFVTYGIDWMGIGDHNDCSKPNYHDVKHNRDWCNIYYLHATMFGTTSIALNVSFGMHATDFIATLPEVDADRLGVMGLSGGGTMTVWTAVVDERMKAAEIICYNDLWEAFGIRDANYCGMQVAPGLYRLVDLPDLQGLIAPRPLLIDIGVQDSCFLIETSTQCFKQLERIYSAAGVRDRLELDLFHGEHAWGGNLAPAFFRKHLQLG